MSRLFVLATGLALSACGRLGFDATGDGGVVGDSTSNGDATGDGQMIDAQLTPGLRLGVSFENTFDDDAEGRTVTCETSCPTFVPGRAGGMAGSFGGAACLVIADAQAFRAPSFTIALWMRATTSNEETMFGKSYMGATTGDNSWELWKNTSNGIRFDTTPTGLTNGGNITLNTWHHLAGTFNGLTLDVYVDGMPEGNDNAPAVTYASDVVRIGCDLNGGTVDGHFTGALDDVRFYDRALSAAEIAALAQ